MTDYLLDSNIIIDISNNNQDTILKVENFALKGKLTTTLFNFIEVYFGVYNKKAGEKCLKILDKLGHFSLTKKSSEFFIHLKHNYLKKGQAFSDFDLLIASIAIENELILLTEDKDFEQIKELNKIVLK